MHKFIAVYKHVWGTRAYTFATPSTAFDGLIWNEKNKLALARLLDCEYDPYNNSDDEKFIILECPDMIVISDDAAAQVWASDDEG